MDTKDFEKTWFELSGEQAQLMDRRSELENELTDVRKKIAHLDQVLDHLAPLADLPWTDEIVGLGITDAIRRVVQQSSERLSAKDVQQKLADKGFDLSDLSAPMASIYKILSRLEESNEIEREKEGSKVFFKWRGATRVSNEEIPF
jgi:hypothetical protein